MDKKMIYKKSKYQILVKILILGLIETIFQRQQGVV